MPLRRVVFKSDPHHDPSAASLRSQRDNGRNNETTAKMPTRDMIAGVIEEHSNLQFTLVPRGWEKGTIVKRKG